MSSSTNNSTNKSVYYETDARVSCFNPRIYGMPPHTLLHINFHIKYKFYRNLIMPWINILFALNFLACGLSLKSKKTSFNNSLHLSYFIINFDKVYMFHIQAQNINPAIKLSQYSSTLNTKNYYWKINFNSSRIFLCNVVFFSFVECS